MDNQYNPAYRLINQQQPHTGSSADQQFGTSGGAPYALDQEVASITQAPQSNIVYPKDPKHIQGFGSNVVHVNVSCGQTLTENPGKMQNEK